MGNPMLILRLEGPLQSWGLRSRWDVRETGDEPSKSGMIGLLGCALGYPNGDKRLEELDEQLTMAVRVEHEGARLIDFQTISGVLPTADGGRKGSADDPSTIISPRTYLQDAAFLVVLAGPEDVLSRCAAALRSPKWPVYLGRKACPPAVPLLPKLVREYENLKQAVERHLWSWSGRGKDPLPKRLRIIIEQTDGNALRPDRIRTNPARMYGSRSVQISFVDFPGVEPEEVTAECISPA